MRFLGFWACRGNSINPRWWYCLEEIGQVLNTEGSTAQVRMNRTEVCAQCGRCGIAALQPKSEIIVDAHNTIGALPGDWVRLEIESRRFLQATFMVFLFPLFAAALGYFLMSLLAREMGTSQVTSGMLGAVLFFGLSYAGIRAYDRRAEAQGKFRPTIVEIFDQP